MRDEYTFKQQLTSRSLMGNDNGQDNWQLNGNKWEMNFGF